jgi:hypothetical protein
MARITPQQRQRYGPFLTGSVPGEVLKAIDDRELEDRLVQAVGLMQQVAKAATPGAGRQYGEQAQRILSARPRAQTEQVVAAKIAKAAALGPNSPQAADLTRQAREELLLNPPAKRRFDPGAIIRKAKAAAQMLACFDQGGKLYGVCDPDDVEMVDAGQPGQAPADQEPPAGQSVPGADPAAQVAKAKGAKQMRAIFDQQHRLIGMIDPDKVTPVTDSLPGAKEAIGKAYARTVAKAAMPEGWTCPECHTAIAPNITEHRCNAPAAQARNTGPVNAGGTTGMGRTTGRGENIPPLPGDVPGRMVTKATYGPPRRNPDGSIALLRDLPPRSARGKALPGAAPAQPVIKATEPHMYARDVRSAGLHSAASNCLCGQPPGRASHTALAPGMPMPANLRKPPYGRTGG